MCHFLFTVTPQPVYVDPNEKHKHKFMVQSVIAPEGKINIDQVVYMFTLIIDQHLNVPGKLLIYIG